MKTTKKLHSFSQKTTLANNTKRGFTLAEVLITLGIIGIVAAMTIPTLMTNYKKARTVAILKENYSILQQAIKLSQDDNGDVDGWDMNLSGSDFFHKYIANYVKWQKEYSSKELQTVAPHYYLNGKPYSGWFYDPTQTATHVILINGSSIAIRKSNNALAIFIDINGISKPNTVGIDSFMFVYTPQYGLEPWGDKGTEQTQSQETFGNYNRNKIMGNTYLACNKSQQGKLCTALIIHDGWTISNDYPWK